MWHLISSLRAKLQHWMESDLKTFLKMENKKTKRNDLKRVKNWWVTTLCQLVVRCSSCWSSRTANCCCTSAGPQRGKASRRRFSLSLSLSKLPAQTTDCSATTSVPFKQQKHRGGKQTSGELHLLHLLHLLQHRPLERNTDAPLWKETKRRQGCFSFLLLRVHPWFISLTFKTPKWEVAYLPTFPHSSSAAWEQENLLQKEGKNVSNATEPLFQ